MSYVTRFAPSPSGPLHIGHAFSALTAYERAKAHGGAFLLRIEDIDTARCTPAYKQAIYDDLKWLGLGWPEPVMRQSDRMPTYRAALDKLIVLGLCYLCKCTRGDIRVALAAPQEGAPIHGPDGLVYPGICRDRPISEALPTDSIRLNMASALGHIGHDIIFTENGPLHTGVHTLNSRLVTEVGDIVLARRDIGTSYHLSVVVDDAAQGITEVVRGVDLFGATQIHVVLQNLLGLAPVRYFHHDLIRDTTGKRLAKRDDARAITQFRINGHSPSDIRRMVGL